MAVPFLDIEDKENYLDQVLALAGVPPKFKYTAEEWNLIRDKINELHGILENTDLGDASSNNIKVIHKHLDVDWTQQVAYNTFVTNKLNASPTLNITGNELYIFYAVKNVSSFVQGADFIAEKHLWIFCKGKGTYGVDQTPVNENDFIYLGLQKNNSPSLQRGLFEIGNTPISEVINLGAVSYAINIGMYNIFNCTRNGDPYSYVFVASFNVIGNYQNVPESRQVFESSFLEIGNTDPVPPSLDNFVTLQNLNDSQYDDAYSYLTDVLTNIGLQNPTEEFIVVETDNAFYFGQKETNEVDFLNCRIILTQARKRYDLEDTPDMNLEGYNFWQIIGPPNQVDVGISGGKTGFAYDRKFTPIVETPTWQEVIDYEETNLGNPVSVEFASGHNIEDDGDSLQITSYTTEPQVSNANIRFKRNGGIIFNGKFKILDANEAYGNQSMFITQNVDRHLIWKAITATDIEGFDAKVQTLLPDLTAFDNLDTFDTYAGFPATGVDDRFYIEREFGKLYRWNGADDYAVVSGGLTLGITAQTAGRGDHTKAAYDHSQEAHAPSDAQKNSDITKAEIEAKFKPEFLTLNAQKEIDVSNPLINYYNWDASTSEISLNTINVQEGCMSVIRVLADTAETPDTVTVNGTINERIGVADNWFDNQTMELTILGKENGDIEWWYFTKLR